MSNQQIKIGLVALALSVIMVFAAALPAVYALTPSSVYETRGHKTDSFPGGQHICGEQLCTASMWSMMKNTLHKAQSDPNKCAELKGWKYCTERVIAPKTSK